MRFADELVDSRELEVSEPSRKPTKREIEMAGQLVESLHERFKPEAFKDTYRERVLEMIKRKAKGEEIEIPQAEQPEQGDDLMAALEASLGGNGGGNGKGGRNGRSGGKKKAKR
jgi:DNA end-binding protein Ku